jgi:hypothetical protein
MRTRTFLLFWLLAAGMALYPLAAARGQGTYEVPQPDVPIPVPLGHDRMETGGFFVTGEYVMYRQTNPLQHQPIAVTGFFDADGSITGHVGKFVGSGKPVLFADDVGGPATYQPGFRVGAGWRFEDGSSVEISWMNLLEANYGAVETLARPHFFGGRHLENTFLSSPVFNFPAEFAGPDKKVDAGNAGATFGIWNAASVMSLNFIQRTEEVAATFRVPIFDTDCWRCYGLVGPRFFWEWERFAWRTVDYDTAGDVPQPNWVGLYTNIVSNRMYGAFIGCGNEWYCGHGFAVSLDTQVAGYLDYVREIAKYETGMKDGIANRRSKIDYNVVPEVRANLNLWWYPVEGVQVRLGYDLMAFFNTIAAPNPVSFNYGGIDPAWQSQTRFYDGINAGIAFIF